jgi:hypothetical protein
MDEGGMASRGGGHLGLSAEWAIQITVKPAHHTYKHLQAAHITEYGITTHCLVGVQGLDTSYAAYE